MKVRPGDVVRIRELYSVDDKPIPVPDAARLTHLQFSRFAGCPICNLHCNRWWTTTAKSSPRVFAKWCYFTPRRTKQAPTQGTYPSTWLRIRTRNSTRNSEWKRRCGVCSIRARRHQWSEHFFGLPRRSGCVLNPRPDLPHIGPPRASGGHTVRPRRGGSRL
jgi:hypothetical protein